MAQASAKCGQASECFLDPRRRSLPASLAEPPRCKRQSALVEGFSLHACVQFHATTV